MHLRFKEAHYLGYYIMILWNMIFGQDNNICERCLGSPHYNYSLVKCLFYVDVCTVSPYFITDCDICSF